MGPGGFSGRLLLVQLQFRSSTVDLDQHIALPNLIGAVATIVAVAVALSLVAPRGSDRIVALQIDAREQLVEHEEEIVTPADRIDASRIVTLIVGAALVAYLVVHFVQGGTITLDIVNWSFLALIFLLVRSPF